MTQVDLIRKWLEYWYDPPFYEATREQLPWISFEHIAGFCTSALIVTIDANLTAPSLHKDTRKLLKRVRRAVERMDEFAVRSYATKLHESGLIFLADALQSIIPMWRQEVIDEEIRGAFGYFIRLLRASASQLGRDINFSPIEYYWRWIDFTDGSKNEELKMAFVALWVVNPKQAAEFLLESADLL